MMASRQNPYSPHCQETLEADDWRTHTVALVEITIHGDPNGLYSNLAIVMFSLKYCRMTPTLCFNQLPGQWSIHMHRLG